MADPVKNTIDYGRELFAYLEEFFLRATGKSPAEFATVDTFGDVVRASACELSPRRTDAFGWLDTELRAFYARRSADAFRDAKQLGGMSLVLGGSSRFLRSQLNSVSTAVLYSDTVLIPDPILPWLETDRTEERFRHVLLLQAAHTLLQLKPLMDAPLPSPPVAVFPSWEKSLEEQDDQTREGISQLFADVLSGSLGCGPTPEEVVDFADQCPERFRETVERDRLFVGPGGAIHEPLDEALVRYEEEMATWRSLDWLDWYRGLSVHERVLNGVFERVGPVYHMLENAHELHGHPLMCLKQHAHYFRLAARTGSDRLEKLGILDPRTAALVQALSSRRLRWLGRIPINILAELRLENETVTFRRRLASAAGRLRESALDDVDRVAAEVCRDIERAVTEHERKMRSVEEKYTRLHVRTAVLAVAAAGVTMMPALAPLLGGAVPLALAATYGHDKIAELAEKRALTQSVVGVLAAARMADE